MASIKAVFTDLDGTLLNPHHRINDYTAQVLKKLKAAGIYFIVATGRPYADVFATLRKCGLEPDFIITSNGARIHDREHKLLYAQDLDPAIVHEIVQITQNPDADGNITEQCGPKQFATNFYREDEWVTDKLLPEVCVAFDESFVCRDLGADLHRMPVSELKGVHEIWFLGERSNLEKLDIYMKRNYSNTLRCAYSLPTILDCVGLDVCKGNAVREVCGKLQLGLDEVAVFGDGMNDESMLAIAGHAFVMSNAQQALKDAVKDGIIIGSNTEDGVAKKLEELFSLS